MLLIRVTYVCILFGLELIHSIVATALGYNRYKLLLLFLCPEHVVKILMLCKINQDGCTLCSKMCFATIIIG